MRACREAPLKPATLARRGDCSNSTASTMIDGTLSNWGTKIVTGMRLFAFIALQQGDDRHCPPLGGQQGGSKVMTSICERGRPMTLRPAPGARCQACKPTGGDRRRPSAATITAIYVVQSSSEK